MPNMKGFLDGLQTVAGHPLALVGYLAVVSAWMFAIYQRGRLQVLAKMLKSIPESQRATLIEKELSITPRAGLSAPEWLRYRSRNLLFVAFLATLAVLVLIVALALYRGTSGPSLPQAALALRVMPDELEGSDLIETKIAATVENTGLAIAEDIAIQLEMNPGIQLTGVFQQPTVHLESLPGKISSRVEWDVRINPYELDHIPIRVSARNSRPQSANVPVRAKERNSYEEETLSYSPIQLGMLSDGTLVLLDSELSVLVETKGVGSERRRAIPAECSAPTSFTVDLGRNLIWIVCQGSQQVVALPINGVSPPRVPEFPTMRGADGSWLSRTPFAIAATPEFVACTSMGSEQCLWLLDWPEESPAIPTTWRVVEYPSDLAYTDCELSWTGSRLVLQHVHVIPASLSFYDVSASPDEPFRTLTGHDFDHISGLTAVVPLPGQERLIVDEYGEYLSIMALDGRRLRRAKLTKEEDWSDGKRKSTVLSVDPRHEFIVAAVNTSLLPDEAESAAVFMGQLGQIEAIRKLGVWPESKVLDLTIVDGKAVALCTIMNKGRRTSTLRRVDLK